MLGIHIVVRDGPGTRVDILGMVEPEVVRQGRVVRHVEEDPDRALRRDVSSTGQ